MSSIRTLTREANLSQTGIFLLHTFLDELLNSEVHVL